MLLFVSSAIIHVKHVVRTHITAHHVKQVIIDLPHQPAVTSAHAIMVSMTLVYIVTANLAQECARSVPGQPHQTALGVIPP
jgi:hypothetical protein